MRQMAFTVAALVALIAFTSLAAQESTDAIIASGHELIGTWKMKSAKYGGQEYSFPEGTTTLKHVTPAQFMWVTYDKDGTVTRTAGGGYTLDGDKYAETPEYGIGEDFESIKGKAHSFSWKVDGNAWHHSGRLGDGLTIEEVWERVEAK